jgi:hypothetical protein
MQPLETVSLGGDRWISKVIREDGGISEICHSGLEPPRGDWLSFRRALIASPEYPSALAIACSSAALSTAFQVLSSAIDFCCQGGVEDQEIAAFQSAIALYLSSLPDTEIGQSISARITTLCSDYHIPLTP